MEPDQRIYLMQWEEYRPGFNPRGRPKYFRRNFKTKNMNVTVYPNGSDGTWRWRLYLPTGHQVTGVEESLDKAQAKADEVATDRGFKVISDKVMQLWK